MTFFFFLFSLQDSVCNGANTDSAWQEGHKLWSCWIALMGLGIMLTALPGRSVTLHQVVNA